MNTLFGSQESSSSNSSCRTVRAAGCEIMKLSVRPCGGDARSVALSVLATLTMMILLLGLGGCGGRVITRDDSPVSATEMERARLIQKDVVRVHEIARKLSIEAVDLCVHKMPQLDFAAFAMPSEGTTDEELQAAIHHSGLDTYTRVVRSWNPAIRPGAKIEKVSFKEIDPSNFGSTVPWFLAVKAVDEDSIDVVIDGVKHTYAEPKVCALTVLYRVEKNPRVYKMTSMSDRFMVILPAPKKLADFERSDDEIAALLALALAANASGETDAAMRAAFTVGTVGSLVPGPAGIVVALLSKWISNGVASSLTNQEKIDTLAVKILNNSGYNPNALVSFWNRCGKDCENSWTPERRDLWRKLAKVESLITVSNPVSESVE